jgi:peptidyl-dipeptidase A
MLLATVMSLCPPIAAQTPQVDDATYRKETVEAFIERANRDFDESDREQGAAVWVNVTYITDDTDLLAAKAGARDGALRLRFAREARKFDEQSLTDSQRRDLSLLGRAEFMPERMPLPADPELREEMALTQRRMASAFGSGRHCPDGEESCRSLSQLSDVMAFYREPDRLLDAWAGWRAVSAGIGDDYRRFVELGRQGARDFGHEDMGSMWRAQYDMTPAAVEAEVDRLWGQVKPLYDAVHCYARARLADHYGEDVVPRSGPIPAHLLGNMWAQRWDNIYDLLEPYPGAIDLNVSAALETQGYTPVRIARTGERFFMSLGLPALPDSFWERSMLSKPADRDVVCRPTAWNVAPRVNDVRMTQCITPTEENFVDLHHELGHIYYYLSYNHLPNIHRRGANGAFHEGIGDAVNLSLTPGYYQSIGLLEDAAKTREASGAGELSRARSRRTSSTRPGGTCGSATRASPRQSHGPRRTSIRAPSTTCPPTCLISATSWHASSSSSYTRPCARPPVTRDRCTPARSTAARKRGRSSAG